MISLIITLTLLIFSLTSVQAKVFQYRLSNGDVTSDFKVAIDPVPGYGIITVAENFEWPVPPAGVGYTSCATGDFTFSRVENDTVILKPNLTVFYCNRVGGRKGVFATMRALAAELFTGDDENLPFIFGVLEKCPVDIPTPVTPAQIRCDTSRKVAQVLSNASINTVILEGLALIVLKGW